MSNFQRLVQIGRVVRFIFGPDVDKIAVIVDLVDHNRVLVTGPHKRTGVPRHVVNLKWVVLTGIVVPDVTPKLSDKEVDELYEKHDIINKWESKPSAKAIAARHKRHSLTDFERFKVRVLKKQKRHVLRKAVTKVKKSKESSDVKELKKRVAAKKNARFNAHVEHLKKKAAASKQ
eukprot:gb/GECH01011212.1/.p1 GENE.gb/GECH01011212.1/~~gb/GECH01011212.1/.p1  ORF type:complete len:175 (+),score=28.87 gb/GECH01011212.1/:1-525(+)